MADYTYEGTDANETISGLAGGDYIHGRGGDDIIAGNDGDDRIMGGSGDDILLGNLGNDTLYGGTGKDILYGGRGDDFLHGGAGTDILSGDFGADMLWGDTGSDVFYFNARTAGVDEFGNAAVDTIMDFGIKGSADSLLFDDFAPGANLVFVQDGANTVVGVDTNGDFVADLQAAIVLNATVAQVSAVSSFGDLVV